MRMAGFYFISYYNYFNMYGTELPEQIPGTHENIYGGFWLRLGSLMLDGIFCLPVTAIVVLIQFLGPSAYAMSIIPLLVFNLWYAVYLPARYGATPGKLVVGLTILKVNGEAIGLKEAIMRNVVTLGISIFSMCVMLLALSRVDADTYTELGWIDRSKYLMTLVPLGFTLQSWMSNVWIYSELIVLLTNKQRRAIHDYVAGTVIVQTKYMKLIREYINPMPPADDRTGNPEAQPV